MRSRQERNYEVRRAVALRRVWEWSRNENRAIAAFPLEDRPDLGADWRIVDDVDDGFVLLHDTPPRITVEPSVYRYHDLLSSGPS
jgi:hypothetical protein